MEVTKRILGCIVVNGILNSLFWVIVAFIYVSFYPPSGFWGDGSRFFIYITAVMGVIIGAVTGFLIGFLNTSFLSSALISGALFIIVDLAFTRQIPSADEMLRSLLFLIIPAILSALASGLTARIFNNSPT